MTQVIDVLQTIIIILLLIIVHFQYKINKNNLKMIKTLNKAVLGVDYERD